MICRLLLVLLMSLLCVTLGAADKSLQITSDYDGKTIALKVGDRFDLALDENPTTGYGWEVMEGLDCVIKKHGEPAFHSLQSNTGKVGGGGTITFHFTATGEGTAHLKLIYHRRWEKDKPPLKTFLLTVTVSPS